jgi:hypothetical protein
MKLERGAEEKIEEFIHLLESKHREPTQLESHFAKRAIEASARGLATLAEADIDRAIKLRFKSNLHSLRRPRVMELSMQLSTMELRSLWEDCKRVKMEIR